MVYLNLLWAYLKIGLFGFGGGYAMLSLIQHEAVEVVHYGETSPWLTSKEFTDIVAISQMTPGPIGINSATYIGYVATGGNIWGSILATVAVCLPSFILVLLIGKFLLKHQNNVYIKSIFAGLSGADWYTKEFSRKLPACRTAGAGFIHAGQDGDGKTAGIPLFSGSR